MRTIIALRLGLAVAALWASTPVASAAVPLGHAGTPPPSAAFTNVFLTWDGRTETLIIDPSIQAESEQVAVIVPTPSPAITTPVGTGFFGELADLTAPEVVVERHWFTTAEPPQAQQFISVFGGMSPPGPPHTSGSLAAVDAWLAARDITVDATTLETLEQYRRDGWSFTAVQLGAIEYGGMTFENPDGHVSTEPFLLRFDTDRLIYPMRADRGAPGPMATKMYVLAEHRLARADADAHQHNVDIEFAGRLAPTDRALLNEPIQRGHDYLTVLTTTVAAPSTITSDATFVRAASDESFRQTVTLVENVELFGVPRGWVFVGIGLAASALVGVVVSRRRADTDASATS
ncbi:DUF2330 domain-containing protein [Nocardia neocaledoniensis]|uniref:DUF2330 domain-containing protein n=1 Tax=Nocardia neocaledoniensis TaxID=236511 RepID=UPI0024565B2B|nr:DUF2330 domain-containing protein [Nocardia neocaledoniensis]